VTNFDFLLSEKQFEPFAKAAVNAEKAFQIDYELCATSCRMALESAVKWLYSVDEGLKPPYDTKLISLLSADGFRDVVDSSMLSKLHYIRKLGNGAAHNEKSVSRDQAVLALDHLHSFLDFIAYCYGTDYRETRFDPSLLENKTPEPIPQPEQVELEKLIKENESLKEQLTARRAEREKGYESQPADFTEEKTRRAYIDLMLSDAGWIRGEDWIDEYPIDEMPNESGFGRADYVLLDDSKKPLAVVEAKRTSVSVERGRQQAVLYANFLEKKFHRRPIIFMTNGYETRIWDDKAYPERPVAAVYSKRDLEKLFNIRSLRSNLADISINPAVCDRYYQKEAVKAVCEEFSRKNRRKALLVMATGSGKTRTVMALVDVLMKNGWVKNVLFLADRKALVKQAKGSFNSFLPDLSLCNLAESKDDFNARAVFSTYPTMMGCIDEVQDENGKKLFTCGHFDLIVVDEAHRSIYRKYRDIFNYFDALLVGLTATPKDDIDKNTYEVFEMENGVPTYGYELDTAVEDGYLVPYRSLETVLKLPDTGITYKDLSDEEKQEYEDTFADEDGNMPESIDGSAINEWIFNEDTIRKVLQTLMTSGQKVDFGTKIGKTVIFAKTHDHAEEILRVWNHEYSAYPQHYCEIIDNRINYAQSLIDQFSIADSLPQIAISVDMLDTGIDVPEILNLVFFKKVMSKAKFWQMVGRGTRLCSGILDGEDKKDFYIFDFCRNFEFFRVKKNGKEARQEKTLQEQLYNLKTEIAYKLQDIAHQTEELVPFRKSLTAELMGKTIGLNRENFAVRQHLRSIDKYSGEAGWQALEYKDTLEIAEEISPLMAPDEADIAAVRFDALMYQIELAYLVGKTSKRARNDLIRKVSALAGKASIPAVGQKKPLIQNILQGGYLEQAGINEFERIRTELRELMKFVQGDPGETYATNFTEDILSSEWHDAELANDDLKNYKKKVNYYIRQHQDETVIAKLKGNIPLTPADVRELEDILWSEVGTKQDYEKEYGTMPLGELVRSIVGLDRKAAHQAFSRFLDEVQLNSRQSYFVEQIVNYIVKNGMMKDFRVLQESPFSDRGSVADVFSDKTAIFMDIRKVIETINLNANVA
jgi:type I restriction enzyme, R subunit